jgi:hypothetical protein
VANFWKTSGGCSAIGFSSRAKPVRSSETHAVAAGTSPTDDDAIADLELDDPTIDEAELPRLDTDDAEAVWEVPAYDDLIDRGWLERSAENGPEDEGAGPEEIGLTIDLDGPTDDEDGAQVVDLDVGSLLTSLPSDATELDLELLGHERADAVGVGALRDLLLPESDDDGLEDAEVGDDERFPVFDDAPGIAPRPGADDDVGHNDDLA